MYNSRCTEVGSCNCTAYTMAYDDEDDVNDGNDDDLSMQTPKPNNHTQGITPCTTSNHNNASIAGVAVIPDYHSSSARTSHTRSCVAMLDNSGTTDIQHISFKSIYDVLHVSNDCSNVDSHSMLVTQCRGYSIGTVMMHAYSIRCQTPQAVSSRDAY